MEIIPLSPIPAQTLSVLLNGQNCQINVYEKPTGVFLDLAINNVPVITGALCLDRAPLATQDYLGLSGRLQFSDILGTLDPHYSGFGTRYLLLYLP